MPESSTTTWAVISPPTIRLHAAGKTVRPCLRAASQMTLLCPTRGLAWTGGRPGELPSSAGDHPRPAGRLQVPRRVRPRDLRRQGEKPAQPTVVVLPGPPQLASAHADHGPYGGQRRVDRR